MRRLATGVASALLVAGCNLAPPYERPPVNTGDAFKEAVHGPLADQEGWQLAAPRDDAARGEWWQIYHDAALSDLESRVATGNQSVRAAEANYRAAEALVAEARAQLFPTLSVNPSVTRSRSSASVASFAGSTGTTTTTTPGTTTPTTGTSTGGTASSALSSSPRTVWSLPLEASWQIDLWGNIRNTVAQDRYAAQGSAAQLANARLSMQAALAQDYFQVRIADEERRVLDDTLRDFEANLHLVQTLYKNGLDSEEDVAQAQTQLKSAQAQATDLGITRATFEHAIAVLIGVAPAQFSLPYVRFDASLPPVPVQGMPADLIERRPDIAAAERQVQSTNAAIGVARAAYFPQLSLSGAFGFESTSLGQLLKWPNRFWSVGPDLAQTLFDGGARRAVTAQARAQNEAAVADYRQTVLAALQSVEDNLATLRLLAQEGDEQRAAADAARHAVKLSVVRFRNGVDSYVNVITAQNAYLTARQAQLQVQLRQFTASVNLVNNLGGGWSVHELGSGEPLGSRPVATNAAGVPAAAASGPGVPNPPPLPAPPLDPEQILRDDQPTPAPAAPPP